MGGSYTSDFDVMAGAAHSTRETNFQVLSILAELRRRVGEVSGFWAGDAQRAFEGLMEVWDSRALQLSQALDGIAEAVEKSRTTYEIREEDTTQSMSSIQNTLG